MVACMSYRIRRMYVLIFTLAIASIYLCLTMWQKCPQSGYTKFKSQEQFYLYKYKETPSVTNRTFNYIIKNEHVCTCTSQNCIHLIIFICTKIDNFAARDALRKTWLSHSFGNKGKIRYVFLIGRGENEDLQSKLQDESEIYGDMVQEDFVDSYENLTLKTIMGLKWVSQNCEMAQFVMKIDDDVYLNTNGLMEVLDLYGSELQTSIGGYCSPCAYPIRFKASKWYISYESYSSDTYPPFCHGPGYITTMSVARSIYEASKEVKLFQLEDVFIGLCLAKLGYGWTQILGFQMFPMESRYCRVKTGRTIITLHPISPTEMIEIWESTCLNYQTLLDVCMLWILLFVRFIHLVHVH